MLPIVFHSVETYQCFFFVCLFGCFFFLFLFLLKSDIVTWVETAKYFVNWTHVHFLLDEILYRFVWNERFGPGSYCKCCRGIEKYPEKGFFLAVTVWYRRKLPLSCHATPSFPYQVVVRDVIKQRSARGESELTPVHVWRFRAPVFM